MELIFGHLLWSTPPPSPQTNELSFQDSNSGYACHFFLCFFSLFETNPAIFLSFRSMMKDCYNDERGTVYIYISDRCEKEKESKTMIFRCFGSIENAYPYRGRRKLCKFCLYIFLSFLVFISIRIYS